MLLNILVLEFANMNFNNTDKKFTPNLYFNVDTIRQLFIDVPIDNILLLKEINLFIKL